MFISGPRASSLGSEQGTTLNAIMKGMGGDHITSSAMFEVSGSVGIGTSSPNAKLEVSGSTIISGSFNIYGDGGAINRISSGEPYFFFRKDGVNRGSIYGVAGGGLRIFDNNDVQVLTITSSNVGIGITNPIRPLHVNAASDTRIVITDSNVSTTNGLYIRQFGSASAIVNNNNGTFQLGTNDTYFLTANTSGQVGIGTTQPSYTLDVAGTGRFTSTISSTTSTTGATIKLGGFTNYGTIQDVNDVRRIWFENVGSYRTIFDLPVSGTSFVFRDNAGNILTSISSAGAATFSSTITSQANGSTFGTVSASGRAVIIQAGSTNQAIMFKNSAGGDGTLFINGTSTTMDYSFNTYSTGDALIIKNNGNIQIGNDTNPYVEIANGGSANVLSGIRWVIGSGRVDYGGMEMAALSADNGYIVFKTRNSGSTAERMRITNGGNILIGNPATNSTIKLHVKAAQNADWMAALDNTGTNPYGLRIDTSPNSGGAYSLAVYTNSGTGFYVKNDGTVSIGTQTNNYIVDMVTGANNSLLYLNQSNGAVGGNAALIANINTTGGYLVLWRYGGSTKGSITTDGTGVAYNTTSDYRLKEDFQNFNAIEKINTINVYDFKWKETSQRGYGVIAHELAEVLPQYVNGEKDGLDKEGNLQPQSVDYSKFVPLLIKSIQELNTKLDAANAEIEALKSK
jgi:hypothetical protein